MEEGYSLVGQSVDGAWSEPGKYPTKQDAKDAALKLQAESDRAGYFQRWSGFLRCNKVFETRPNPVEDRARG